MKSSNKSWLFALITILANNLNAQPQTDWVKQYTFPDNYRINTITFVDGATWAEQLVELSGLIDFCLKVKGTSIILFKQ